jgi:hypothetical protein
MRGADQNLDETNASQEIPGGQAPPCEPGA